METEQKKTKLEFTAELDKLDEQIRERFDRINELPEGDQENYIILIREARTLASKANKIIRALYPSDADYYENKWPTF